MEPTLITCKGGYVVLIGAEDWEDVHETLAITDIQGAVECITLASDYQTLESNDKYGLQALINA